MPITFLHIPFVLLLFLMVALPGAMSLLMLIPPASRNMGKKVLAGAIGATIALIIYQVAYIPFLILGLLFTMIVGILVNIALASSRFSDTALGIVLLLFFYIFWFIALIVGYISGFRAGWRFASGSAWRDCVKPDYLVRLILGCYRFFAVRRKVESAT